MLRVTIKCFLFILLMYSCEYEYIETPVVDPNIPVSFSAEILPILTTDNNCTACHKSGSQSPYFTEDQAYNSIVPALIDNNNPENSKFYVYPNPESSQHQFKKYSPAEAALVLVWIQQGAKDN